jgi:acyl carrier protein
MAITQAPIAQTVERFIRSHFRVLDTDPSFHRGAHLYEGGFVDSAGVVELIAFVESTFKLTLEDEDVFSEEFTTINGISSVLTRLADRRSGAAGLDELDALSRAIE